MKIKLENLKEKARSLFNDAQWAGIKEVSRWVIFYFVSGVVTQMLSQIAQVPASWSVKVWVFNFSIAIRSSLKIALTLTLRYIDKKQHTNWKLRHPRSEKSGGLVKW